MWLIVRAAALLLLAVMAVLIAGRGSWLLTATPLFGSAEAVVTARMTTVGLGLALGVIGALVPPLRRVVAQFVTLLHELGHTVVAAALGARPAGIVLRHDASGHATARWVGRATPLRRSAMAAVAFAGLPAAAATTAAGTRLLLLTGPEAVLWSAVAAAAVVAGLARRPWSLLVAVGLAGAAFAALSETGRPWAAAGVVGLLAATAITTSHDNLRALRHPIPPGDDARSVAGRLLPPRLVQLVQVGVGLACSAWTLWLLVGVLVGRR